MSLGQIKDYTPNFNLIIPRFDIATWHDYMESNFRSIDALFFNMFGINQYRGEWQNSTTYQVGDVLFIGDPNSQYTGRLVKVLVVHTTTANDSFDVYYAHNPINYDLFMDAAAAEQAAKLARDWAIKTDGKVQGLDYSSKYYANLITPISSEIINVSNISNDVVNVSNISADVSNISAISTKIITVSDNIDAIQNAPINAQLARDWAVKMDGKVNNEDYSSKYYAQQAASVPYNGVIATGSTQSRMLTDRFADVINVKDYGAKGDGVTDDSAAFALVEAKENQNVYVPEGVYKISNYNPATITKNYFGPGELLFGNGDQIPLVKQINPLTIASAQIKTIERSIVFIGDSITIGEPFSITDSYVDGLQKKLRMVAETPQCNRASFCRFIYENITGDYSTGTAGPIEKSLILRPGAALSFNADFVDYLRVYYMRNDTTTDVTISCDKPSISEIKTTSTGDKVAYISPSSSLKSKQNAKITITNSGSNNIEITGIGLYNESFTGTIHFTNISCGGHSTENYAKPSVLDAIAVQTYASSQAPIYVIVLGTNDSYGNRVSPNNFKANLEYIVSGLLTRVPTAGIILCHPWIKRYNTTTLGTPGQYRDALNSVAVKYGCTVFDGAELDISRHNDILRAVNDNIHFSKDGYKLLTEWFWKKLGLDSWVQPEISVGFTAESGVSLSGTASMVVKNKMCFARGVVDFGSSTNVAANTPIFHLNNTALAPKSIRYFTASSDGDVGTVTLYMDTDGIMKVKNKTATNIRYIFLDGIFWSLEV